MLKRLIDGKDTLESFRLECKSWECPLFVKRESGGGGIFPYRTISISSGVEKEKKKREEIWVQKSFCRETKIQKKLQITN
jgi:hypothetical protein